MPDKSVLWLPQGQQMPRLGKDPVDMHEQDFALRGDRDTALGALENRHAEMGFQLAHLLGQSRLADPAAFRGAAEMLQLRDRFHIFKIAQGQAGKGFRHRRSISRFCRSLKHGKSTVTYEGFSRPAFWRREKGKVSRVATRKKGYFL